MCPERTHPIASLVLSDHTRFAAAGFSPLIVTALFDGPSFALLDGLRRRHFPSSLNRVPAHATLFHHLPGEEFRAVADALREATAGVAPPPFAIGRTAFLGRGVALALDAPDLVGIRETLARSWRERLTAQDRQAFRPHVTIQNKVAATEARETQARLEALLPIQGRLAGLALWHYRGGPWDEARRFPFAG